MPTGTLCFSETNFLSKECLNRYLRNQTAYTPPATVYAALQRADTLAAGASIGASGISMTGFEPPAGSVITIGVGLGTAETFTTGTASGGGPFTVPFASGTLAHNHSSGEYVMISLAEDPGHDQLQTLFEVANAGSYVRNALTYGAPVNLTPEGVQSQNATSAFGVATTDWGLVTGVVIVDSATWGSGNHLYYGDLNAPVLVLNGQQFVFAAGGLNVERH